MVESSQNTNTGVKLDIIDTFLEKNEVNLCNGVMLFKIFNFLSDIFNFLLPILF